MSSSLFKFKQFTIAQEKCAMKIGTDGVLLGAWVSINNKPNSILDIGSGTGVIALQLGQRTIANTTDAIEIDDDAFEQCTSNFENSPWGDRLFCYHASLQEFAKEMTAEEDFEPYDLIVSNPPFFESSFQNNISENKARVTARFRDALPFEHLIIFAAHLLSNKGIFAVIIPFSVSNNFIELCKKQGLFLVRKCNVQGNSTSVIKRSLLEFSFHKSTLKESHLIIEKSRHNYTWAYKELVQDFYLKM